MIFLAGSDPRKFKTFCSVACLRCSQTRYGKEFFQADGTTICTKCTIYSPRKAREDSHPVAGYIQDLDFIISVLQAEAPLCILEVCNRNDFSARAHLLPIGEATWVSLSNSFFSGADVGRAS